MRKVSLIAIAMILIFSVSVAFGFGIPKLKGTLKKAEKELKLSDLGFKKFEGTDLDPFKDSPYKYNVYGDKDFDAFFTSSNKIIATTKFANKMTGDLATKVAGAKDQGELDAVKADAENLQKVLTGMVAEGAKLAASSTKLISGAKNKFKKNPMDLKVLPDLTKDMKSTGENLTNSTKEIKSILEKLTGVLTSIPEKAKTFAG